MKLDRRQALACAALPGVVQASGQRKKVFRMAFQIAETGFDPARISDIYSRIVTGHIFEALYGYDPLARPVTIVPRIATAMPEVSEDFRRYTVRIRPGVLFQDDPAFGGKPRELVAEDFVYAIKRFADPKIPSPMWAEVEGIGILGLAELREQAKKSGRFDYDAPLEGLRALDRHRLQFSLRAPRPRLVQVLAQSDLFGAVAREVVERYGDDIPAHPVGTGPFRLVQWRRSSFIALERNAGYRELRWDTLATDPEALQIAARLRGKRLPLIDRVEVTPIEESQPRWLSFLNGEHDFIERLPPEFTHLALPNGRIAPNLAKRGMQLYRQAAADCGYTFFNMEDAQLGGVEPHRVALRRAISLGLDVQAEIALVRRGQAVPAQSPVLPHSSGFDPAYKSENSEYNPAKAKGLLDAYGYLDRDGDGWARTPGWPAAEHHHRHQPGCAVAAVRRAVEPQPARAEHPAALRQRQMARAAQAGARRQAAAVDAGPDLAIPGRHPDAAAPLRPGRRTAEPFALQACALRRPLRAPARTARRPRARGLVPGGQAHPGRVHADQGACAPRHQRHGPALGHRLPPPAVLGGLLAVH